MIFSLVVSFVISGIGSLLVMSIADDYLHFNGDYVTASLIGSFLLIFKFSFIQAKRLTGFKFASEIKAP
jgi:hypothetical protein